MNRPGFIAPYIADADIAPYLIVKFGSVDGNCAVAGASSDNLLGVSGNVQTAAGQVADVVHTQATLVTYGGTVPAGAWLTSDSQGRAVAVATTVTANVIGKAIDSGVVGDVKSVLLNITRVTAQ